VDLSEVIDERFIDFPLGWGVRSAVDRAFNLVGVQQRRTMFETNDMSTVLDLVRLKVGVAFVPSPITRHGEDLEFLLVRPDPPTYDVSVAASRLRRPSPVSQQFLRIILADRDG
jgi:DNA-binding transcriptional LysR family regulator